MSLQEILMSRAALHFQNELGPTEGGTPSSLFEKIAVNLEKQRQDKIAKEEENKKFELLTSGGGIGAGNSNSDRVGNLVMSGSYEPGKGTTIKYSLKEKEDDLKVKREKRLTDQYSLNNATRLRQEFINRNEVKDYITVNTNVKAMESLLEKALVEKSKDNYVAVDQGLITMYNKLTDPQSVVRESEYARTAGNLPVVNRIYGAIGKLQKGGAGLTNDDRKALVEGAKIIMKERGNQYNNTLNEYNTLSTQYELDPSMVTRGMKPYESSEVVEEPTVFNSEQEAIEAIKQNPSLIGKSIQVGNKKFTVKQR